MANLTNLKDSSDKLNNLTNVMPPYDRFLFYNFKKMILNVTPNLFWKKKKKVKYSFSTLQHK